MYHLPSTWRRLLAHYFDSCYILILQSPVIVRVVLDYLKTDHLRISWPYLIYFLAVSMTYEILSLYFFSATLGKYQWKLRVIGQDSNLTLRLDQIILRVLTSRLSFFLGGSIFALALFKYDRTHLADWVARTQVVSLKHRKKAPKIRWIVGSLLVLIIASENLKSASGYLSMTSWQKPFVYLSTKVFKDIIDKVKFAGQAEEDEDDDED